MKNNLLVLLAAGMLSTATATAQTSTQTVKPTTRTERTERKAEKDTYRRTREARKERRLRRNNAVTTPADMSANSPADNNLKNGGEDRTGTQPAR
ncbi:MAG: hypothetical protein EOP52_00525 [Sphingobacteriales bacterium]|nr:MAG: hypothetical protein EOP52_00525 [Sphingobacteriales bacterium]